jgi:outer membrane receptor for ferrienterochelin and colicins
MFDLFVGLKYTGRMFIQHYAGFIPEDKLEESPKFLTVDASISKKILLQLINREVVLTVGGRNITNEYQRDFDQGILRDAGYRYGPRFPRSFYTTLAVNF